MNNIDILEEKEKKAIKDLKEISHYCSLRAIDIDNKYSDLWARYVVSIQIVKNLIETLIAENKELKERNKRQQENLKIANKKIAAQRGQLMMLNKAYIPKSKVKAKIKELEKEQEEIKENEWILCSNINRIIIKVLQSLLGKE